MRAIIADLDTLRSLKPLELGAVSSRQGLAAGQRPWRQGHLVGARGWSGRSRRPRAAISGTSIFVCLRC